MPTFEFETIIAAPLDEVWAYHQDPLRALPELTPPDAGAVLEGAEPLPPRVGTRVTVRANVPFRGEVRWVARYVDFRAPHAVVFGREARFVDEAESGPFASWRHEHDFEAIDDRTTRLTDRVTYRVGLGPVGWVADVLLVRRKLSAMFRYRRDVLNRVFPPTAATTGGAAPAAAGRTTGASSPP